MTTFEPKKASFGATLLGYLELMRFPNLFTAMADVVMGFLFVRGVRFDDNLQLAVNFQPDDLATLGLLAGASTALYAGGSILNDVFDMDRDVQERPGRALPSGRVSRSTAAWFAGVLLLGGTAMGGLASGLTGRIGPAGVAGALVLCILCYDGWAKLTVLGPFAMGACRSLNVLFGMSLIAPDWLPMHGLVAAGIGVYVAGVTWFARTEADESNRWQLCGATLVLLGGLGLLALLSRYVDLLPPIQQITIGRWHLFVSVLALLIAWRCLWAILDPRPFTVQTAVRQCILSLVMLDAAACFAACGVSGVLIVLPLLVPALVFGQFIRST